MIPVDSERSVILADLVVAPSEMIAIPVAAPVESWVNDTNVLVVRRSWVFRFVDGIVFLTSRLFGIISIIFLAAATANIPVLQLLSFGYLIEVTGRLAHGGKINDAMIGLQKASRIGGILLGTWLLLFPIRFFSDGFWYEAYLIDPHSPQTRLLRVLQIGLISLAVLQITAAWACGGKLRYFFWPLIAPFSFLVWTARRLADSRFFRPILNSVFGWVSPHFVEDICRVTPPGDWFVPAILWRKIRQRRLYTDAREGVWNFLASLNLWYYFQLGLKGFVGTVLWLLIPTLLMVASTGLDGAAALFSGLIGTLIAIPVFSILPFMQARFSTDGKLERFLEVGSVFRSFRRAPLAHVIALLLTLLFALPLFLLKIEAIPAELLWTLSIVFIAFTWPSKIAIGLAYRRGSRKQNDGWWWTRWPIMSLAIPVSFAFVLILFFTRYVTWHGALSLLENHVFLLPAPFWL